MGPNSDDLQICDNVHTLQPSENILDTLFPHLVHPVGAKVLALGHEHRYSSWRFFLLVHIFKMGWQSWLDLNVGPRFNFDADFQINNISNADFQCNLEIDFAIIRTLVVGVQSEYWAPNAEDKRAK